MFTVFGVAMDGGMDLNRSAKLLLAGKNRKGMKVLRVLPRFRELRFLGASEDVERSRPCVNDRGGGDADLGLGERAEYISCRNGGIALFEKRGVPERS